MLELVQLEKRHADFASRNAEVIVVSMEETKDARLTQEKFPHLVVMSDSGRGLSEAVGLVHVHAAPDGSDADMPTTILLDRTGVVRWIYRTPEVIARLSPDELLEAIDRNLVAPLR
jgi:peroxiredoxin